LRFVDLIGAGLRRLGADGRLTAGDDRSLSQRWSLALYHHPERPDGLLYRSRHDQSRVSVAIYDRALDALGSVALGSLAAPNPRLRLAKVLDTYAFALLDDPTNPAS
jgi:hypothetical protein